MLNLPDTKSKYKITLIDNPDSGKAGATLPRQKRASAVVLLLRLLPVLVWLRPTFFQTEGVDGGDKGV